jgi:hypothetical protein
VPLSEADTPSPSSQTGLIVSAGLFVVLAALLAYGGIVVALTLATNNGDAKAAAAATGYVLAAFAAPVLGGVYLARRRRWVWLRGIRFAAVASLLVHVALLPVALAAFAM